ncbi:uncharacterized protein LOC118436663 [Folsomia candida]|uniref:Uncharacterized protein n=1 Tax=Folsomia candida TaxID=158441 RepID=A0A226DYM4_FOLCA|nr:uncharacterized protein LOC118436663 [Folsomia candida]XP_035711072.1 uncharacterized protein LOC118436663 [Folsomia candida]XP_035711073.1 uncharacterized protein LOC118436663 [Folsomia candida]OXA49904.1 hypothetical protein Fcan01_15759 [Folsomia candida]
MGDPRQNDGHQDIPNLTPGTPSISIKTFQDVVHKWVEGHELNSKEQLAVFHKLIDILCDQNLKDWSETIRDTLERSVKLNTNRKRNAPAKFNESIRSAQDVEYDSLTGDDSGKTQNRRWTHTKGLKQLNRKVLIKGAILLVTLAANMLLTYAISATIVCHSQINEMQNTNISSTTYNPSTTTGTPKSFCTMNPSLKFDDTYSPANATELIPNWNKPKLDLCHDSETILIITEPLILNEAQEIRCSERVTGPIIFVTLTNFELQAFLNKFCHIMQISFVGNAVCRLPNDSKISEGLIFGQNLQAISFEELEDCSEFYRKLGDSLIAKRLTTVAFKCTSFKKEELQGLEYFFSRQGTPSRVKCSNEKGCVDLDLSVNRQAIVDYSVVSCL